MSQKFFFPARTFPGGIMHMWCLRKYKFIKRLISTLLSPRTPLICPSYMNTIFGDDMNKFYDPEPMKLKYEARETMSLKQFFFFITQHFLHPCKGVLYFSNTAFSTILEHKVRGIWHVLIFREHFFFTFRESVSVVQSVSSQSQLNWNLYLNCNYKYMYNQ